MTDSEKCPKCDAILTRGSEPVTVSGVYGDYRYLWGKLGGAHVCRAIAIVCHQCGAETPINVEWDS